MPRAPLAAALLGIFAAAYGCADFSSALQRCIDEGRCADPDAPSDDSGSDDGGSDVPGENLPPVEPSLVWGWDHPFPQGNPLNDVAMLGNQMWAVGEYGTVLHWDGARWELVPLNLPQRTTLSRVAVSGDGVVVIGTDEGLVGRIEGNRLISSPISEGAIDDIDFANGSFAVASAFKVFTSDNGTAFTESIPNSRFRTVSAGPPTRIYGESDGGMVRRREPSGAGDVWVEEPTPPGAGNATAASFPCMGTDNGMILVRVDGSWVLADALAGSKIESIACSTGLAMAAWSGNLVLENDGSWRSQNNDSPPIVAVASSGVEGYAVGGAGRIIRVVATSADTTTVGELARNAITATHLNAIARGNDGAYYVAGGTSAPVAKASPQSNGPPTWAESPYLGSLPPAAVYGLANANGSICGVGTNEFGGGGRVICNVLERWIAVLNITSPLNAIDGNASGSFFAVGATGMVARNLPEGWRTNTVHVDVTYRGVQIVNDDRVLAVGNVGSRGALVNLSTSDRIDVDVQLNAIWSDSEGHFVAVGEQGTAYTGNAFDLGAGLTPLNTGVTSPLYAVEGTDAAHVWITTDGAMLKYDGVTVTRYAAPTGPALRGLMLTGTDTGIVVVGKHPSLPAPGNARVLQFALPPE